jgi:hypothetical protein
MRKGDGPSWTISTDRWNQAYDWALWMRAAERIDTPAGGVVPGPLDIDPLPTPSTGPDADKRRFADPAQVLAHDLAEGWLGWWHGLTRMPRWRPEQTSGPPPQLAFLPPDFPGLARWPDLRRVVADRWQEGHEWHTRRKFAGVSRFHHDLPKLPESLVVLQVEGELGRRMPPFELELILLPVLDEEIREVTPARYLVPESVYDGPGWTEWLRPVVTRLASAP